jgi:hypothetical protein
MSPPEPAKSNLNLVQFVIGVREEEGASRSLWRSEFGDAAE